MTSAIVNLELGNQKKSLPSKPTAKFIQKKFDKSMNSDVQNLSKRHVTSKSKALLQAA